MALTQLSDAVIPERYVDYGSENDPELTLLVDSGILVRDQYFDDLATNGGTVETLPFWKDLAASTESNYSDDTSTEAVPQKLGSGKMIARISDLNEGWSAADLVMQRAGSDPMQRIKNTTTAYWSRNAQRSLIATLKGIYADNLANDSGDMINDVSGATNADVTSSTVFTVDSYIDALFTSGDKWSNYNTLMVHSTVMARMDKANEIVYMPASNGTDVIPTYRGKRLIVDDAGDTLYTAAGGSGGTDTAPFYTSILFGAGAFGFGDGAAKVPVAIERNEAAGSGGGIETLWERKRRIMHPFGFQWVEGTIAGDSPTWAELGAAAHWDRVFASRKNVPLAFLVTNG